MSDAARLVDELTTLLYEPCLGTCITHGPDCRIVVCGACRKKADRAESVVHEGDCPVYRLQRAEAANDAVIRANAEEIADLEDERDRLRSEMECRNELASNNARLTADLAAARAEAEALRDVMTDAEIMLTSMAVRVHGTELVAAMLRAALAAASSVAASERGEG